MAEIIYVAGTGRSGTHLVGRTVGSHPDVEARIENPSTFKLITKIATQQDFESGFITLMRRMRLRQRLKSICKSCGVEYVLEKSHPSLWLAEDLLNWFPQSKFIAVWRNVEPTVASMLRHKGVQAWYSKLPLDRPNRFLGIDDGNKTTFARLGLEERCALRWRSHKMEIDRLQSKFPSNFHSIHYDGFVKNLDVSLSGLNDFLGLPKGMQVELIDLESLDKWKTQLSDQQLVRINEAIHF